MIIRGPSGSGKTTAARSIAGQQKTIRRHFVHLEADMFYTCLDGSYKFDPALLGKAHKWCQLNVEQAMIAGYETIVVSNTSMTLKELNPYLEMAEMYNYRKEIVHTPMPWDADILFERNVHNVPMEVLKKQIAKYQPHPLEKPI